MAENGVENQYGADVNAEDHRRYINGSDDRIPKQGLSNGNPFLSEMEKSLEPDHLICRKSPSPIVTPEPEEVKSTTIQEKSGPSVLPEPLIDFGVASSATKETGSEEVRAEVHAPSSVYQTNSELLDVFDPLQKPSVGENETADDLFGMMDEGKSPSAVEVFAAPPPDDEQEPEMTPRGQESIEPLASPEQGTQGQVIINDSATSGPKSDAPSSDGPKPSATKEAEKKQTQTKASPRPGSTSGGGGGDKTKAAGANKSAENANAKSKIQSKTTGTTPKSATPSMESPKKTPRNISHKGQNESDKGALQTGSEPATRASSAADQSITSPGSTPRSPVSATGDGRSSSATIKSAKSKIGSLDNSKHAPGGGNVKISSHKMDLSNVTSKCGSKDNMTHTPGGGQKRIESRKVEWKAESKVGSMDNARHRPGGGEKKIESKKLEWSAASRVGSMENAQHKPGGGEKKIESVKLDFKEKAQSKVGSKDNMDHKPGGGTKKVESVKLNFQETAQPKVGSKDNIKHMPGGGDKKIENQKLNFNENATSKIGSISNTNEESTEQEKSDM